MKLKGFIAKLIGLTAVIALIGGLVFSLFLPEFYLPVLPYLLLFFFIVTILIHWYQLKLAQKSIASFARSNMLITFFKLVLYSIVAIIYIALDSSNALPFVICLMLLYLVYTFFEVSEITRNPKPDQEK
jgi:hypothetical protein